MDSDACCSDWISFESVCIRNELGSVSRIAVQDLACIAVRLSHTRNFGCCQGQMKIAMKMYGLCQMCFLQAWLEAARAKFHSPIHICGKQLRRKRFENVKTAEHWNWHDVTVAS